MEKLSDEFKIKFFSLKSIFFIIKYILNLTGSIFK